MNYELNYEERKKHWGSKMDEDRAYIVMEEAIDNWRNEWNVDEDEKREQDEALELVLKALRFYWKNEGE